MGRPVAVMGLDGDGDKHIMVIVCLDPPEAYVNKDNKHIGHIVAANVIPIKDAVALSERENKAVIRAHFALKVALENAHAAPPLDPFR